MSRLTRGKPIPNASDTTTYTYRTHDLDDDEASPRRIKGTRDWHINNKLGRLEFEVEDWPSNKVQFKIDKRSQVSTYALDWASYYAYKRANAKDENELKQWGTKAGAMWTHCFSFAGHVYNRHGLGIDGSNSGMYPAATAPDEGLGSLRFFWTNMNPPTATNDPGHVGIVGPLSGNFFGYGGTRIDNNGLPEQVTQETFWDPETNAPKTIDRRFNGPTWRTLDEGVGQPGYFSEEQDFTRRPRSRTLPAKRGGLHTDGKPKSLLQELDEE